MLLTLMMGAALADCVALTGAMVHMPDGQQRELNVVIEGERIRAVESTLAMDCQRVDVSGKIITPGFVDPSTALGLVEVGMEAGTHDHGGGSPSYRVVDGYNPRSPSIVVARKRGVTSTVATPSGGLISGQSAWVDLAGDSQGQAVQQPSAALHFSLGASAGRSLGQLRVLLADARAYGRNKGAYEGARMRELSASRADLEALQGVLRGQLLVVSADRASDIEAVLRFAGDEGLKVAIRGGAEAWLVREQLAEAGVPVILNSMVYGPGSFDQVQARPDNAALLHGAGVPILFSTFSSAHTRELSQYAGNAVREGLDHGAAIQALTLTPAQVFGMADHGRIAPGAVANLVVWDGDPLELQTEVERVFIHGEQQSLVSRQDLLRERYRGDRTEGSP